MFGRSPERIRQLLAKYGSPQVTLLPEKTIAEAGGDLTRIDSIDFSIDDPSVYYQEAREEAIAEAKDKAEQLTGVGEAPSVAVHRRS